MIQKQYFAGQYVKYDDQEENINYGINYLSYDLSPEESKVFFNEAKTKGQAQFEDHYHRNFTLIYNNDYTYTLLSRD